MGAYYHQDFLEESGGLWEALDAFVADEPRLASALDSEISEVLAHFNHESDLNRFLLSLGSCVYIDTADGGYRGWLSEMRTRITAGH